MAEDGKVTIPGEDFFKSLGRLEAMAGGGETPQQPASGDDVNKAQLFHTPSSSEPAAGGWPGGKKYGIGNKWDDSIGKDGTDYHPARKAIAEKALKGIPLAPEELAILKGDISMAMSKGEGQETQAPHEGQEATLSNHEGGGGEGRHKTLAKGGDNNDDDTPASEERDKGMTCKSLDAMQSGNDTVQKGIEISPFLAEFAKAFGERMDSIEKALGDHVTHATNFMMEQVGSYLEEKFGEQGEFNKGMADAIVNIGHGVAGNIQMTQETQDQPAGPPKSQLQVLQGGQQPGQPGILQKSFEGPGGESLTKGQISDVLVDMVEKGNLNPLEVSKFDMTNELRPDLHEAVLKHIQAAGQK